MLEFALPGSFGTPKASLHNVPEGIAPFSLSTPEETTSPSARSSLVARKRLPSWMNDYPQKRFILPEETAALVSHLCKDEACAINSEAVQVATAAMRFLLDVMAGPSYFYLRSNLVCFDIT